MGAPRVAPQLRLFVSKIQALFQSRWDLDHPKRLVEAVSFFGFIFVALGSSRAIEFNVPRNHILKLRGLVSCTHRSRSGAAGPFLFASCRRADSRDFAVRAPSDKVVAETKGAIADPRRF